ncbi:MAG TPA: type II toxin-antitoxin system RelE/ParE family toxin [Gammaproteobacteria bacterium]|nr:type II toxin-antitoxin system RelE/ParE family toxin [Gammaproteobacteria bacterium]
MPYEVVLTEGAVRDLDEIYNYIVEHDSPEKAEATLARIERAIVNLHTLPERGTQPRELVALGIREYREAFFKPYRAIYRIVEGRVVVLVIADGRRDMQSLLARRLLDA